MGIECESKSIEDSFIMMSNKYFFLHKPWTICAPEVLTISTATFIFSKLPAWEVQL